ncbi:MAG: hypothetical protein QUS11_09110 [Candidatus Fermentibacter sp.]|nr:hypothetical protein [Candidatus Fermentibacter sp.]
MRSTGGFAAAALVVAQAVSANGGPIGGSRIVGTGDIRFEQTEGVELKSEDLAFVVDGDYVDVDVEYILENSGPARRIEFAFPVDYISDDYDLDYFHDPEGAFPDELDRFSIFLGDVELMPGVFTTDTSEIVLDDYTFKRSTCWFTTPVDLEAGSSTLRVSYRYQPYFLDAAFSKSWLPYWSPRTIMYRLDPAGYWGDGVVDRFDWSIDLSQVIATGDRYSVPAGGRWVEPGIYAWSGSDVDLKTAGPLTFSYEVYSWKASAYTLEHRIGPDDVVEIRASSVLASQGGIDYGPENLLDLDFTTAWCPGGSSGGAGSWIEIELEPCLLGEIYLVNGYTKSEENLAANSRIRSLRVIVECDEDNPLREYGYSSDMNEIIELEDPGSEVIPVDDREWTALDAGNFTSRADRICSQADIGAPANRIRIEVLDIYPGDEYQDLCVSEIVIAGYDQEAVESWYSD